MTYKVEAVIPLETRFPTLRTSFFTPGNYDRLLEKSLDLIEERREKSWSNWPITSISSSKGMMSA